MLAIPTIIDGGNHTRSFADAAATTKAHYACLDVSKALAATGVRVLIDDKFFAEVWFHSNEYFFDQTSKRNGLGRKDIQRRSGRMCIALGISVELKKLVLCYVSMCEFSFVNNLDTSYHLHARMTLNDSDESTFNLAATLDRCRGGLAPFSNYYETSSIFPTHNRHEQMVNTTKQLYALHQVLDSSG